MTQGSYFCPNKINGTSTLIVNIRVICIRLSWRFCDFASIRRQQIRLCRNFLNSLLAPELACRVYLIKKRISSHHWTLTVGENSPPGAVMIGATFLFYALRLSYPFTDSIKRCRWNGWRKFDDVKCRGGPKTALENRNDKTTPSH